MKKLLLLTTCLISLLTFSTINSNAESIQRINVNSNGRFLQKADGKQFFPVADTAWELPWLLNRQDILDYLETRKNQKFNTINIVAFVSEGTATNTYGKQPFQIVGGQYDPLQPITSTNEYDYWDNLDFIINSAAGKGLYVVLLPAWGSRIAGDWGSGTPNADVILDVNNASNYASWISARYQNYTNIIWMLGGDRSAVYGSYDYRPVFRKMADGVLAGNPNRPLMMSYHPRKWLPNSSEWFHNDSWLSFNSIQDQPSDQINAVRHDYSLSPAKPTWLFEGGYEERHGTDYGPWQVRFQAYQTVFAGGFGYTYGHMSIWEFLSDWKTKINAPGANDMQHLYNLMNSITNSQFFDLIPDQSIIDGDTGSMSGSEGIISSCIVAMRTSARDLALIYSANGRNVRVKMNLMDGSATKAQWFNPRDGSYTLISTNIASGTGAPIYEFDPPGSTADGNDYVLILESSEGSVPPPEPVPPYTDDMNNLGLLHCDSITTNLWPDGSSNCFIAIDDNSSGRTACSPIMNSSNNYWTVGRDDSTMPSLETNSPYSGNYLHFDGGDAIIVTNGWHDSDNMKLDLAFRLDGLPDTSDNYMGVFMIDPIKVYVQNDGGNGKILTIVYKTAVEGQFLGSSKTLTLGNWYHLSLSVSNNNEVLVVGNDSEGYQTDTKVLTGIKATEMNYAVIGNSFWVPARTFQGDMDEIRWGVVVPEPFSFGLISLIYLFTLRKLKK